ncbi:MAG: hypothetical protein ABFC77_06295 [Thermoguttaceae bacterium]
MLRLFRSGAQTYQPEGLEAETGDPRVSRRNIHRLRQDGLDIAALVVRPTGTLVIFTTGEQYYAPALRVGGDGRETEILAELASESGWGDYKELLEMYHAIPQDWIGPLPSLAQGDQDDPEHGPCRRPNCPLRQPTIRPDDPMQFLGSNKRVEGRN